MVFDDFCWKVTFSYDLGSCLIITLLFIWLLCLAWLLYFERNVIDVFLFWSWLIWQPRSRLLWFTVIILLVVFNYSICIPIFLLSLSFSFAFLFIFVIPFLTKLHFLLVNVACIRGQYIRRKVFTCEFLCAFLLLWRLVCLFFGFIVGWRLWWFWEVLLYTFFEIIAIRGRSWRKFIWIVRLRRDGSFEVLVDGPYVILINFSSFLCLSFWIGIGWVFILIVIVFLPLVFGCSAISFLLPPIFLSQLLSLPYFHRQPLVRVLIPHRFQILPCNSATDLAVISLSLYIDPLSHIYVMIAIFFNQLDSFLLAGGLGEWVQVFFVLLRFQILHLLILIAICIKLNHRR